MVYSDFNFSFSENPTPRSIICARCEDAADIQLMLLREKSHLSVSFCFACSEGVISTLRQQPGLQLSHFTEADRIYPTSLSNDEGEGGIIFWEGHAWSSDGPFAGA